MFILSVPFSVSYVHKSFHNVYMDSEIVFKIGVHRKKFHYFKSYFSLFLSLIFVSYHWSGHLSAEYCISALTKSFSFRLKEGLLTS